MHSLARSADKVVRRLVQSRGQHGGRSAQLQNASQHDRRPRRLIGRKPAEPRDETRRRPLGIGFQSAARALAWTSGAAPLLGQSLDHPTPFGPAVLDECLDRRGANARARYPPRPPARRACSEATRRSRSRSHAPRLHATRRHRRSRACRSGPGRPAGTTLRSRVARTSVFKSDTRRGDGSAWPAITRSSTTARSAGLTEPGDQRLNVLVLLVGDFALPEQGQERLDDRRRIDRLEARRSDAPAGRRNRTGRPGPRAARRARAGAPSATGHNRGTRRSADQGPPAPGRPSATPGIWATLRTASSRTRGSASITRSARSARGSASSRLPERDNPRGRGPNSGVSRMKKGLEQPRLGDVDGLVGPERFQAVVLVLGVVGVEPFDPARELGHDLRPRRAPSTRAWPAAASSLRGP